MNLKGKSFLKLLDFTPEEINYLIDYAAQLKKQKKEGTNNKGEKQALARRRQACMEHAIMWQEVWI